MKKQSRRKSLLVRGGDPSQQCALDLKKRVFTQSSPRRVAQSLKRSAEASRRRKGTPYQSAMSMLNFYINRAAARLTGKQKSVLIRAKGELKSVFHR